MKKRLIGLLLSFITAVSFFNIKVYAADSQTISFNNIKSIMIENSIDMKIADNNLKNTKQELQKINDDIEDLGYKGSTISKNISTLESEIEDLEKDIKALRNELSILSKDDESYSGKEAELKDKNDQLTKKETDLKELENYKDKRTTAQRN
ncbi:MAG: hypothetical protein ACI398_05705, partial [Clostridium sp.]